MPRVSFIQEGCSINVEQGISVLEAMRRAGLQPDAPCGGNGKCGKCQVRIDREERKVLACRTIIEKDLLVNTDLADKKAQILTASKADEQSNSGISHLSICQIQVPPCPIGKSISDWTRFAQALSSLDADYEYSVPLVPNVYIASRLPGELKKNNGYLYVLLFEGRPLEVSAEPISIYSAAFDIGTTTVAGYLLRGDTGERIAVTSRMNPQTQFGADVISRAGYCLKGGMKDLYQCIRRTLSDMITEMAEEAKISAKDIYLVSIAGNTCMHHLYLGIDVDSLVHAPYNPAVQEAMILEASDYELGIQPQGKILMLPNIAGFVGADTVSCLVASDLAEQDQWTLLIDIGTNGEMVLGRKHHMAACSTAAGPAFEGAGIAHGMRGASGAISKARWKEDHWELSIIDDVPCTGICGSGLLDLAAELRRWDLMDEMGMLEESTIELVPADASGTGEAITLCQKDIRELQMAKAAIRAGIQLLAEKMQIAVSDISQVWLAGAFGSFMDPDAACDIGMIPLELKGKITAIGNAAGLGAQMVLRDKKRWELASELAADAEFIELACMPEFQERFVDALEFPEL